MADYTAVSLERELVEDVEAYLGDEPFGSVKVFVGHLVLRELEWDETEAEARVIGQKLRDLGYVE